MKNINNLQLPPAKPSDRPHILLIEKDEQAILKSASGFLKILYPHLNLTLQDYERDCLETAVKMRQQIRNLLYHLDDEFKQYGPEIYAYAQ